MYQFSAMRCCTEIIPFELERNGNPVFGKLDGYELYESEKRGLGG